jgi:hypothetical protein
MNGTRTLKYGYSTFYFPCKASIVVKYWCAGHELPTRGGRLCVKNVDSLNNDRSIRRVLINVLILLSLTSRRSAESV